MDDTCIYKYTIDLAQLSSAWLARPCWKCTEIELRLCLITYYWVDSSCNVGFVFVYFVFSFSLYVYLVTHTLI